MQSDLDLILDNDDGPAVYTETGTWTTSTSPGFNGGTYRFAVTGTPATATWNFYAPFAGEGEVFVQYRSGSNRASNAVYHINTGNGIEDASIDQKVNDQTWVSLGNYSFTAGSNQIVLDAQASTGGSVVIADVVRIVIPAPSTETADFDEDGDVDGRDFLAWQRGFGKASPVLADGDANADESVDGVDLGNLAESIRYDTSGSFSKQLTCGCRVFTDSCGSGFIGLERPVYFPGRNRAKFFVGGNYFATHFHRRAKPGNRLSD